MKRHERKNATIPNAYKGKGRYDLFVLGIVSGLVIFGIIMVYNSSVALAIRDFGDQYYYVREQLKGLVVGIIALIIFSRIHYRKLYGIAIPVLIATLVLLMAVFLPGIGVRALGASRWIRLGPIGLQPAEFAKLAMVIYLSAWFSTREKERFFSFLILISMVVGLVLIEPDMGTSIILIVISIIMYFVSGAPLRHFALLAPCVVGAFLLLAVISPYRFSRITTFLHPSSDPLGASYQVRQALLAVGSGGFWGVGLGKSRQKYEYLPEANTDSIFAIVAEEGGFVGSVILIGFITVFLWRGFSIAIRAPDRFSQLLCVGIVSWIGFQTMLNIAANLALLPLTGIPLPFISYGSSGLVITLAGVGILLNISRFQTGGRIS
jgi:cell division protein FtsW